MKPPAVILAGGHARRLGGGDKLLLKVGGQSILDHIVARLTPQVSSIAINANGDPARFPLPVIADSLEGVTGPLAGLHAALAHARDTGAPQVLTVPGDVPFLPADLVARLSANATAIATSAGHSHYVIGLWPTSLLDDLVQALTIEGVREMHRWCARVGATPVEWQDDPFFNINTPGDLAKAAARL